MRTRLPCTVANALVGNHCKGAPRLNGPGVDQVKCDDSSVQFRVLPKYPATVEREGGGIVWPCAFMSSSTSDQSAETN